MTRHLSTLNRALATACLFALWFPPTALASTECVNGVCSSFPDRNAALSVVAIAGIVIGVTLLLSIIGVIFAVVRYRRIRRFQRTYVQNAQANAAGMNMGAPTYPSPAYEMPHHSHHMQHHNQALEHHNQAMAQQNQLAMQNYASPPGIGGMSGSTGMTAV